MVAEGLAKLRSEEFLVVSSERCIPLKHRLPPAHESVLMERVRVDRAHIVALFDFFPLLLLGRLLPEREEEHRAFRVATLRVSQSAGPLEYETALSGLPTVTRFCAEGAGKYLDVE